MEDFTKIIIQQIGQQLTRGYILYDSNGYAQERESPIQSIIRRYVDENREIISKELGSLITKEMIENAVKAKIDEDMKSDWMKKSYQEKFLGGIKEKLEQEIVKDLKVLLDGKKITVEIN